MHCLLYCMQKSKICRFVTVVYNDYKYYSNLNHKYKISLKHFYEFCLYLLIMRIEFIDFLIKQKSRKVREVISKVSSNS